MPRSVRLPALLSLLLLLSGCGTASNDSTDSLPFQAAATPDAAPSASLGVGGQLFGSDSARVRCTASAHQTDRRQAARDGDRQLVVVGALNLRGGPGTACGLVGSLGFGTEVTVLGEEVRDNRLTWRRVSTPQGEGFVIADALQRPPERAPALIPVLMYHRIGDGDGDGELFVTSAAFEAQLRWLRDQGYVAMTPADLVAAIDRGLPLPARPIIISIDDYWHPTPEFMRLMETHGFRGTYFLPNGASLSRAEIAAMAKQGQVCGHTVSHPYLDQLDAEAQLREVSENKRWLEEIVGLPVTCFAYPFGHYDDATVGALKSAGFEIAFDAKGGQGHLAALDRWHVPRLEVSGRWSLTDFAAVMGDIQARG